MRSTFQDVRSLTLFGDEPFFSLPYVGFFFSVVAEPVFMGIAIHSAVNPPRGKVMFTYGPDGRLLKYGLPTSYGPPEDAVEPPSVDALRKSCWFRDRAEPPEVDTRTEEAVTAYVECVALRHAIWGID